MKFLCFGEILWDVYPDVKYIGGAPLNFSAHAVKHGAQCYIASALGCDELGDEALEVTKSFGINTDYVSRLCSVGTGKCVVTLDENRIPSYNLLDSVAYDFIDVPCAGDFDMLYFGSLALRGEHNKNGIKKIIESKICKEIFVDVNIRKPFVSYDALSICLENANYLKVSDEEIADVCDIIFNNGETDPQKIVAMLIERYNNLKLIIFTKGENGSCVYDCKSGKTYTCDALKVELVSTVGAGDSFGASFMCSYFSGKSIEQSLDIAKKVSGYVVSSTAAVPDYDVSDFIKEGETK